MLGRRVGAAGSGSQMRTLWASVVVATIGVVAACAPPGGGPPPVPIGTLTLASVGTDGALGYGFSREPSISGDGRTVAFTSLATGLVPGDTNTSTDVFLRDLDGGTTTRISVTSDGAQVDSHSDSPAISSDGRYVAFRSSASNLVPGDTNVRGDVFVHDLDTGTTTRVSVASDGTEGNDNAVYPAISSDGRSVTFASFASNLVPGDTNGTWDVFVHDLDTGTTTRVSVASDGTQSDGQSALSSISGDGNIITYQSLASTLVPGDTNGTYDVFVHDRDTGSTTRVSVGSDGTQGSHASAGPAISGNGRFVIFSSGAALTPPDTNSTSDVFVHDRDTGTTTRISESAGGEEATNSSNVGSISSDGRYIAYESAASNLVPGDTNQTSDAFVHDTETGITTRVSLTSVGRQAGALSYEPAISSDGRIVAFASNAPLVPGDSNGLPDVFVLELFT